MFKVWASDCSPARLFLAALFLLFSAWEVWLIYVSVEPGVSYFSKYFWYAYAVSWLLVDACFGGIHDAPSWIFIPVTVIAVLMENVLAWYVVRKIVVLLRRNGKA